MKKQTNNEPTFSDRVLEAAMAIPEGRVTTYGTLAKAAGGTAPVLARAVTGILGKAYEQGHTDIPFHRIVYSDGRVWVNNEHQVKRMKLYKKEGIEVDEKGRIINFKDILYTF